MLLVLLAALAPVLFACSSDAGSEPDAAAEWRHVLSLKPDPSSDAAEKQRYADALHRFVAQNPGHPRAREVWDALELEHARELAAAGASDRAIERLQGMVKRRASNAAEAGELLRVLREQEHVTDEELDTLEQGMTAAQIAELLGNPRRGWKRSTGSYESWFYRYRGGGVAAVHFRNGRVIAVDVPAPPASGSGGINAMGGR